MSDMHSKCQIVHALIERATADIRYYLDKIEQTNDTGWSPNSLRMIQMNNDAAELQCLAARVAELRSNMIRHFVPAE